MNGLEPTAPQKQNTFDKSTGATSKSLRTRTKILQFAQEIIQERGGVNFQMLEIAQRCHMSKSSLYYYFKDRDEIVQALLALHLDEFIATIESRMQETPCVFDALRAMCEVFAESVQSGNSVIAMIASEMVHKSTDTLLRAQARFMRLIALIEHQIKLGQDQKLVRADVDAHMVSSCICGTFFFAAYKGMLDDGPAIDIQTFSDDLLQFILRGIAS